MISTCQVGCYWLVVHQGATGGGKDSTPQTPVMDLLADRNKAFEMFRKSYRKNEAIEDNKALLKTKYNEAKALGETVNQARQVLLLFQSSCRVVVHPTFHARSSYLLRIFSGKVNSCRWV